MGIYLIAYDLVNEARGTFDYQPLWDELVRLKAHRTQYSLWLLRSAGSARDVAEHLIDFIDEDDRIWVTSVRRNEYWYSRAISGTNAWLKNNPPS